MVIERLMVLSGVSLSVAMKLIDREASGICFVIDGRRLVGVVTDGDIRRGLLDGKTLDMPVDSVMKKEFFTLPVNSSLKSIQEHLGEYKYIPILNEDGEFVDLASPDRYHQIPLVQPVFDGNELEYVTDCIRTGWISSQGKYVRLFEEKFGEYVNCPNTLAVSNGTVALHLALVTLGIGPGDEVIVPDLTFAAPINAILYVGATPVMVDVDRYTMAIDPGLLEGAITARTRAIIAVHLYGHPADMVGVMELAEKNNLKVIEDCAEALGSRYKDVHVGSSGHASIFSFFGNKTITTGEGGMVLFKDESMRERAKILRDHGMAPEKRYWHNEVGFNYRLTNIQAAIGVAQLEKIETFVEKKRWMANHYNSCLAGIDSIQLPIEEEDVVNSYWLYTIVLEPNCVNMRDKILAFLNSKGVEARPVFFPLHIMPPYQGYNTHGSTYDVATHLSAGGISLPSSVTVTQAEIERVCETLIFALTSDGSLVTS
ncbi:aminotransferase class I/II-fold pyridoxal phosphate-dependent enzyme [Pseudomonadales bacterium]|nr:aminotransferase class I/II-fold pyridoxal phosphate-dependent enzyme [Pseudomonadales bacterium]